MAITTPINTKIISFSNLKAASSNSLFLFTKETYLCLLIIQSFKNTAVCLPVPKLTMRRGKKKSVSSPTYQRQNIPTPFEAFRLSGLRT